MRGARLWDPDEALEALSAAAPRLAVLSLSLSAAESGSRPLTNRGALIFPTTASRDVQAFTVQVAVLLCALLHMLLSLASQCNQTAIA